MCFPDAFAPAPLWSLTHLHKFVGGVRVDDPLEGLHALGEGADGEAPLGRTALLLGLLHEEREELLVDLEEVHRRHGVAQAGQHVAGNVEQGLILNKKNGVG